MPHVQLVENRQIIARLEANNVGRISAVTQKFVGDFSGTAMLILSQESDRFCLHLGKTHDEIAGQSLEQLCELSTDARILD
ncbi:MAG: hypothetical protein ACI81O_001371 [Cyclobacteriaceae bacterium]